MKYAYLSLGFILFGIFGLVFLVMFESITVNNESEYYVLKEAMEAAMLESVDLVCFRNSNVSDANGNETGACNGSIKISEQKFVENFTRRFAASVMGDASNYKLEFYDIIEKPPKATVVVTSTTQEYTLTANGDKSKFDIVNNLSGILQARDWEYLKDVNVTTSHSGSSSSGGNSNSSGNGSNGNQSNSSSNNSRSNGNSGNNSSTNTNVTVMLNTRGGTLNGSTGVVKAGENQNTVTVNLDNYKPTRDYYTFLGWCSSSSCSTSFLTGNQTVTRKGTTTYYAKWRESCSYL